MRAFIHKVRRGFSAQIHHTRDQKGQSLAEFILTFGIVCLIVFLFVKLAFNFTKGYMVHYANFMASRAYLVQDNNSASPPIADSNAEQIAFNKVYKKIFPVVARNKVKFKSPVSVEKKVFVGVTTNFEESFSLSSVIGGSEKLKLISESFLGRTPVISECAKGVCTAVSIITGEGCGAGDAKGLVTLWDNGC